MPPCHHLLLALRAQEHINPTFEKESLVSYLVVTYTLEKRKAVPVFPRKSYSHKKQT